MSRIGKQIINIPEKTEVIIDDSTVTVKGPIGELKRTFLNVVSIKKEENKITVNPVEKTIFAKAMWGTVVAHIKNMISGVNKKFEKELIIDGVGYKAILSGKKITFSVGLSHSVNLDIPEGVDVEIKKNNIKVSGIDKEKVGLFASKIRLVKKVEPYKGKGIKYVDEVVRRKEGKRAV